VSLEELEGLETWICFACNGICSCVSCRRQRGEEVPIKPRKKKEVPVNLPKSNSVNIPKDICSISQKEEFLVPGIVPQAPSRAPLQQTERLFGNIKNNFYQIPANLNQFQLMSEFNSIGNLDNVQGSLESLQKEIRESESELTELREYDQKECGGCNELVASLRQEVVEVARDMEEMRETFKKKRNESQNEDDEQEGTEFQGKSKSEAKKKK
jgi:hypothetical protein